MLQIPPINIFHKSTRIAALDAIQSPTVQQALLLCVGFRATEETSGRDSDDLRLLVQQLKSPPLLSITGKIA